VARERLARRTGQLLLPGPDQLRPRADIPRQLLDGHAALKLLQDLELELA
jgi:hypothetical protein